MLHTIDSFLNSITMYRLALYGLLFIASLTILLGFTGFLPFSGISLLISFALISAVGWVSNTLFANVFKAVTNVESGAITSLILFLIMSPPVTLLEGAQLAGVVVMAMGSKYLLAIGKKHIFNPAAIAATLAIFLNTGASWWIATPVLLPATAIIGALIVRKIHRSRLLLSFIVTSVTTTLFFSWLQGQTAPEMLVEIILSWPIIFLGTVMLTEPLTTPPTQYLQMLYGVLVGVMFGTPLRFGLIRMTPELALVLGNIFSYLVSSPQKLTLKLLKKIKLAPTLYDFVFQPDQKLLFSPGQYLEWTMPHTTTDSRGNRRYFTIASSPTESEIRLGVKIPDEASTFKKTLKSLKPGDILYASQLAGDFTLPTNPKQKLVFIAGGIGITPFRSMIKYLLDTKQKRDVVLFYAASDPQEFTYQELFAEATKKVGVKSIYVVTHSENAPKKWTGEVGRINEAMFKKHVSHLTDRTYYISGPPAMVSAYTHILSGMGVPAAQTITDYFPGF